MAGDKLQTATRRERRASYGLPTTYATEGIQVAVCSQELLRKRGCINSTILAPRSDRRISIAFCVSPLPPTVALPRISATSLLNPSPTNTNMSPKFCELSRYVHPVPGKALMSQILRMSIRICTIPVHGLCKNLPNLHKNVYPPSLESS